jgi:hypothetical protein
MLRAVNRELPGFSFDREEHLRSPHDRDVEVFQTVPRFHARVDQYIAELDGVPLAKGVDAVFYPGEPEARSDGRHRAHGLSLCPAATIASPERSAGETNLRAGCRSGRGRFRPVEAHARPQVPEQGADH